MGGMTDAEERRGALMQSIERFTGSVAALPDSLFLRQIDGRSPRDIVAHLIGWNRYAIEAQGEIRRGRLPACLADPGPDFSTVNEASVRRYASRDRGELLEQLRDSAAEYDRMLRALPPDEWDENYGVTWHGRRVTAGWLASALVHDYDEHREEIASWTQRAATA